MKSRYYRNRALGEIIEYSNIKFNDRIELLKFYESMVRNKDKKYSELEKAVSDETKININKKIMKRNIDKMKEKHSILKSKECNAILGLSVALEENNKDKELLYRYQLELIEEQKEVIKNANKYRDCRTYQGEYISHEEHVKRINKDLDVVLREKKHPTELYKKELITISNLNEVIRSNIKNIGSDRYFDYIECIKNIKGISKEELKEIEEVLTFFISNLKDSYKYLKSLNPDIDELKIRSFKVNGEQNLKPIYTKNTNRLYTWKVETVERRLNAYNKYLDIISILLNTGDLESIKSIEDHRKKVIKLDAPYLIEDYDNIFSLKRVYKDNVTNINNLTEEEKENLGKAFKKRFIMK